MNISRLINFICIILGGAIALYAQADEEQNVYILIGGISLLMFGIYRLSRHIPNKLDEENETSFVKTEEVNED